MRGSDPTVKRNCHLWNGLLQDLPFSRWETRGASQWGLGSWRRNPSDSALRRPHPARRTHAIQDINTHSSQSMQTVPQPRRAAAALYTPFLGRLFSVVESSSHITDATLSPIEGTGGRTQGLAPPCRGLGGHAPGRFGPQRPGGAPPCLKPSAFLPSNLPSPSVFPNTHHPVLRRRLTNQLPPCARLHISGRRVTSAQCQG